MPVALAVLALAVPAPASAGISFAPPSFFPAGAATTDLVVGDFNRDGPLDVATVNAGTGSVSVLLGDGKGALGPPSVYSAGGPDQRDIATGDFNSDGTLDLAVPDGRGHVAVLQGGAGGTFSLAQSVQMTGFAHRVAVGDVNGDGFADLVTSDNDGLSVALGDGAGGFGSAFAQDSPGSEANGVALVNLNGDKRADAITADGESKTVSVLPGNPDGSMGPPRSYPVRNDAFALATGDFDGDGNVDVAVGRFDRSFSVLPGDGNAGFGPARGFLTVRTQAITLVAADFDGDGRLDLGVAGSAFDTLRGTGSGAFETATSHIDGSFEVAVGDLDADSRPDVIATRSTEVGVGLNTSTPGPPPLPQPIVARTANVEPVSGAVLVKQPGSRRFIRLDQGDQIPIGSLVDTTRGSVRLTSAAGGGKDQSGVFRGGLFKLGQKRGPRPFTELKLATKLRCVNGRKPANAAAKRPRTRRLFGNAHGRFRTRGRHSVATIRGTKWLVKDTCRSTTTVSLQGTVIVGDLVKHRTVTLRTGQRYVARRGNR